MKVAYIQSIGGASGDMLLGAFVDLGVPLEEIATQLNKLSVSGFHVESAQGFRNEIRGTKVDVVLDNTGNLSAAAMLEIISDSSLSEFVKSSSLRIFHILWDAECRVHGHTLEEIELDELGTLDTIVDVVGVCICLDYLGVESVYASPLVLGSSRPPIRPGGYSNPAPATLQIISQVKAPVVADNEIYDNIGELTTPTGAAIITGLATFVRPEFSVSDIGVGLGGKDPESFANIVRVWLGDISSESVVTKSGSVLLETNIDDSSGETLGYAKERLFGLGALDVWFTSIQMKKDRPGVILSALVPLEIESLAVELILRETSTLGVRRRAIERYVAKREIRRISTDLGDADVKLKFLDGVVVDVSPEYEDCRGLSLETGMPLQDIMRKVRDSAWSQLESD